MREDEYRRLDALDESLWWLAGLRELVLALLGRHVQETGFDLLDAGCGTGGMLKRIGERFPQSRLHGLDYAEEACALARRKSRADIRCGSVESLPWADGSFDAVVSLDVLSSDSLDPVQVVNEFRRVLRPGGLLLLNLPAYQWLLSYHDRAVHQSRRFTAGSVRGLCQSAGLRVIQLGYWNTVLFPLMVLRRKVWPSLAGSTPHNVAAQSDVQEMPAPVNALFGLPVALERALIRRGVALPFGGSVIGVARKPS